MHLIGAIIGDIAGSKYEFNNRRKKDFKFFGKGHNFTDDTVMTCAVALTLMNADGDYSDLQKKTIQTMQAVGQCYPYCGYGARFFRWIFAEDPQPLNSLGNGAAMRISPVARYANSVKELKRMVHDVTVISHDHPEGLKAAEATAMACWYAKKGHTKEQIRKMIEERYYPEIADMHVEDLHRTYKKAIGDTEHREWATYSVPQALVCFFESESFEDAIRNCVYIGGDCDTTGAIAGGVAEYYYGVPKELYDGALKHLDSVLRTIVNRYYGDNATS